MNKLLLVMGLYLTIMCGCSYEAGTEVCGIYVDDENKSDSLFLGADGFYSRKYPSVPEDTGEWYIKENDIWFGGWVARGDEVRIALHDGPALSGFTLRRPWLGKKHRIYYSVYEWRHFKQVSWQSCDSNR